MQTLIVERHRKSSNSILTIFRTIDGKVIDQNQKPLNQIRKNTKETIIKGIKYNLLWESQ